MSSGCWHGSASASLGAVTLPVAVCVPLLGTSRWSRHFNDLVSLGGRTPVCVERQGPALRLLLCEMGLLDPRLVFQPWSKSPVHLAGWSLGSSHTGLEVVEGNEMKALIMVCCECVTTDFLGQKFLIWSICHLPWCKYFWPILPKGATGHRAGKTGAPSTPVSWCESAPHATDARGAGRQLTVSDGHGYQYL